MSRASGLPTPHLLGDHAVTLVAIGALAATTAAVAHETLGHAGTCLVVGGRVTLLTSIWFRCLHGGGAADVGGPIGSLACAGVALALLRASPPRRTAWRIFLLTTLAIAGFWFFGQLVVDALRAGDDWGGAARDWPWPGAWRPLAIVVGVIGYVAMIPLCSRLAGPLATRPGVTGTRALVIAWLAGVASAAIAGATWRGDLRSALEGANAVGLAPLAYLLSLRLAPRPAAPSVAPVRPSWRWIAAGLVVYAAFLVGQARGVGPLARTPVRVGRLPGRGAAA